MRWKQTGGKDILDAVFQRQFLEWAHELFSWILPCTRMIRPAHPLCQLMRPQRWHDTDTYCRSLYWLRIQTAQWIGQSECTPLWNIQTMVLASRTQQLHCPWELRSISGGMFSTVICTKLTINTMNFFLQLFFSCVCTLLLPWQQHPYVLYSKVDLHPELHKEY